MSKCFIIDKESVAVDSIKNVLMDFPLLNTIDSSFDVNEATNIILKEKPELVFLNVDSVFENAFSFVNDINQYLDKSPNFIAISKNKDNAYRAIKYGFFDYLVKPMSELEIRKSLSKFKKKHLVKDKYTLCLKSYKDYQYIDTNEILFLKADNNTTDFYIKDSTVISAFKTLKIFEMALPNNFLRIHKSYIVNKDYVSRLNYGKQMCTVDNATHKIPFTKTYIDNIEFIKDSLSDISIPSRN